MALRSLTYIELCAGTGMLGVAVEIALDAIGYDACPVCYVEREAVAAAALVDRLAKTPMGCPPIWDDVATFDGTIWRGHVDILCGGYPCQPFSCAGKRLAERDPRHLWPHIHRIIKEIEPGFCFFENVDGHMSKGAGLVFRDLDEMGYSVTPGLFESREIGATMRNTRLFILASSRSGEFSAGRPGANEPVRAESSIRNIDNASGRLGATNCKRREERPSQRYDSQQECTSVERDGLQLGAMPCERGEFGKLSDGQAREQKSDAKRHDIGVGKTEGFDGRLSMPGIDREGIETGGSIGDLPYYAFPSDIRIVQVAKALSRAATTDKARAIRDDACSLTEQIYRDWETVAEVDSSRMPAIESGTGGMDHWLVSRSDRLRLVGNGVDVLEAAYAFLTLIACAEGD